MPDSLMEPLEPYEPQTSYDWEPEEEPYEERSNVLWGRVAFYGGTLLLAFILGYMMAPNGASQSALDDARAELTSLQNENEDLQTELADTQAALEATQTDDTTDEATPTDEASPADGSDDTTITGENYVVRSGDTLNTIAAEFYGDTAYGDYLAEVNHIDDPGALSVGTTLIIPDESEIPEL
jgi:nucleoid-associated protein YgaU